MQQLDHSMGLVVLTYVGLAATSSHTQAWVGDRLTRVSVGGAELECTVLVAAEAVQGLLAGLEETVVMVL
jgi:hypothetical protein